MLAGDAWTRYAGAPVLQLAAYGGDCGDEESAYGAEGHQLGDWIVFSFGVNKSTKTIL